MKPEENYININKNSWNNRIETHLQSDFYDMKSFMEGASTLQDIELPLLGNVKNKSILHLQCHFGQDSISLSRLGANVTGIDLSDKAIDAARKIAEELHTDTQFLCCDLYELPQHLHQKFDLVFTSYGTIGWLPDLSRWAKVIAHFLKPGGKLVFAEFHPVVWMFDDEFKSIAYSYFNEKPIVETENGTYADKNAEITQESVTWNHSLAEVIGSLIENGLQIQRFQEFDYSPYNCFQNTIEFEPGKFRIQHLDRKIPIVYALVAGKSPVGL